MARGTEQFLLNICRFGMSDWLKLQCTDVEVHKTVENYCRLLVYSLLAGNENLKKILIFKVNACKDIKFIFDTT